jgi:hypothetical protein
VVGVLQREPQAELQAVLEVLEPVAMDALHHGFRDSGSLRPATSV